MSESLDGLDLKELASLTITALHSAFDAVCFLGDAPLTHIVSKLCDLTDVCLRVAYGTVLGFTSRACAGCRYVNGVFLGVSVTHSLGLSALRVVTVLALAPVAALFGAGGLLQHRPFAHAVTRHLYGLACGNSAAHSTLGMPCTVVGTVGINVDYPLARLMRYRVNVFVYVHVGAILAGVGGISLNKAGGCGDRCHVAMTRSGYAHIGLLNLLRAIHVGIADVADRTVPILIVARILASRSLISIVEHSMLVLGNGIFA